jgi:ligand-binding sensor domain-containing protein
MRLFRNTRFLILVATIFVLIPTGYLIHLAKRARTEMRQNLDPQAKRLPTRRLSRQLQAIDPPGVRSWPFAASIRDVATIGGTLLLATDAGLVTATDGKISVFHHGNGLPVAGLVALTVQDNAVYALAPEGLLVIRGDWSSWPPTLSSDMFSLDDQPAFLDLATTGDRLWLLDDRGRLLQFGDGRFGLVAQGTARPAGRLGLLDGRPVVGTSDGRLVMAEGIGAQARFRSLWPAGTAPLPVLAMSGENGKLLVGTPGGLWRVDALGAELLLPNVATSAVVRGQDAIWIGGPDGTLRTVSGNRTHRLPDPIYRLRMDGDRLLVATANGLWSVTGSDEPKPVLGGDVLAGVGDPYITALLPLPDGDVLVGTLNRGLWRLPPDGRPGRPAGLSNLGINRLVAANGIWVATTNGLFLLDSNLGVRRRWTDADGLPHRYVASVLPTTPGPVVATSAGLAQVGTVTLKAIDAFHGLAGNHLYCLARHGDAVAVGGLAGLNLVGGTDGLTVLRSTTAADGLPHNWVNALLSRDGKLYVGTYGGGIAIVEEGQPIRAASGTAGLSVNPEAALLVDDLLLFGTLTRGLVASRSGARWAFVAQPMLSPNVTALAAAPDGLWIGTDRGLIRLDRQLLMQALD